MDWAPELFPRAVRPRLASSCPSQNSSGRWDLSRGRHARGKLLFAQAETFWAPGLIPRAVRPRLASSCPSQNILGARTYSAGVPPAACFFCPSQNTSGRWDLSRGRTARGKLLFAQAKTLPGAGAFSAGGTPAIYTPPPAKSKSPPIKKPGGFSHRVNSQNYAKKKRPQWHDAKKKRPFWLPFSFIRPLLY